MAIYTLPGPIYDYSVKLIKFEADTIEFQVKEKAASKQGSRAEEAPQFEASLKLTVNYPMGLSNVRLSITPSDSELGQAVARPEATANQLSVVGNSQVLSVDYVSATSTLSLGLAFRRKGGASPAQVTFQLNADQLQHPVSVNLSVG